MYREDRRVNAPRSPDNTGALFRNERKAHDREPDFSGKLNVDGREFRVCAWTRDSRNGVRYLRLAVRPKNEADARQRPAQNVTATSALATAAEDFNDALPF